MHVYTVTYTAGRMRSFPIPMSNIRSFLIYFHLPSNAEDNIITNSLRRAMFPQLSGDIMPQIVPIYSEVSIRKMSHVVSFGNSQFKHELQCTSIENFSKFAA